MQITFKYVYSTEPEHSASVQRKFAVRFWFTNFRGDSGGHFSHGTQTTRWLHVIARMSGFRFGKIYADNRRSFGEPVAFKNSLFEAFLEIFREIERKLFRAGDDETQTAQLSRIHFSQITAQKCRRRQQKSQFVLFDQRCVLRGFQRIWISDNAHPFNEWIPKRDRRSECVKKRKRRENGVVFRRVEQLSELRDVSDNVAVADHNAFGVAGASACKKQDCFRVAAFF